MKNTEKKISALRTAGVFIGGRACSDTAFHMLCRAYGQPMNMEERAAMLFAGGMMQHGFQCGLIWGATLAAGAEAHRRFGPGRRAQVMAMLAAQRLAETFRDQNQTVDCYDITATNSASSKLDLIVFFLVKGGTLRCVHRAAAFAPAAHAAIERAWEPAPAEEPDGPVSCAAEAALAMGASDLQATMAAGLAGGIGLGGGACGALGAAIWMQAVQSLQAGAAKVDYPSPAGLAMVHRFLKTAEYEFPCATITGKTFSSIDDHARHVRADGCARILAALAEARLQD